MDEQVILDRIVGRKAAIDLLDLNYSDQPPPHHWAVAYWECLRDEANGELAKLGVVPVVVKPKMEPMDDRQAKSFEQSRLSFGRYTGQTVWQVLRDDPSYLDWLTRANEEDHFKENLRSFMLRKDVQEFLPGDMNDE